MEVIQSERASRESPQLTTFVDLTLNATARPVFEIRSDSRKIVLAEISDNSLGMDRYVEIMRYLDLAEKRRFIQSTKEFVAAHRQTLERLAKR